MFEVIVERPTTPPAVFSFADSGPVLVGRAEHCGVRIDHPLVSRTHLHLCIDNGALQVQDASTNGTFVGERLLRGECAQVPLDTPLRIGTITLQVRAPRVGATTPSPDALAATHSAADSAIEHAVRRDAHRMLLEHLDLINTDPTKMADAALRPKVVVALRNIVSELKARLPEGTSLDRLVGELADEALGLGPLEQLLADPSVSEIMVVDPETIYVERKGSCVRVPLRFTDDARVRAVVERIVTPLGRRIDESSPLVDARLKDGSRVNAIIPPLAIRGTSITIRKFPKQALTLPQLIELGSIGDAMAQFLVRAVAARKNIVVSGGTGSGKTTLLNVLSSAIGERERIVTIEDSAELSLRQPHVVSLETRPANMEGLGEYTIRDLVKNALRMRPDRIVVGECRGGEALDMLQAMNTGHDGSLTTLHANSPREAVMRLETLCLMSGLSLPSRAIREQIARTLHLVVQQQRLADGSRKVVEIAEVTGLDRQGEVRLTPLYRFSQRGVSAQGKVEGHFAPTGYLPSFLDEFLRRGLVSEQEQLS
ncbi:MAG TPA: ATPase, T2SS/T4P/T4SS family [Polyangiales bacterium]|nr:ATPase, T2SS/T4P/T4SS family [Polyangiales bacterium]